jgi:Flp pilus assembly protein CpaB
MGVVFNEDVTVRGILAPSTLVVPVNSITTSTQVQAGANLNADKLEQRFFPALSQPNSAATTETRSLFVANRAGTVNSIKAGSIAAATGNSTVTLDIKKNGTTILSAVITLDNANTARITEAGVISGAGTFITGDWYEVVITATVGTGTLPFGVFIQCEVDMDGA